MSLLTPPNTSHRTEKDNVAKFTFAVTINSDVSKLSDSTDPATSSATAGASPPSASSSRNVIWSPQNSYHSLATPPKPRPSAASTNAFLKDRPIKPILKRTRAGPLSDATNNATAGPSSGGRSANGMLSVPEDLDGFFRGREATPEPSDPLCDLNYLDYPVTLILKPDAKLRELTEGYSVLSARLRSTVQYSTDADASWPLFQPLRRNREAFVECVVRDLGRAFVDPVKSADCPKGDSDIPNENWDEEESTRSTVTLPSPQKSPKKAKKGMSAEQVKFARDLCTTSHSVIKLLCVFLCFPAVHGVFEPKQIRAILGALLAIPMASDLPTPNARKTCALAIMVLQCQRLPEAILLPTRDRISLALKRGIDGELGKEGKKGSANDGLKAIGDLSIYQPTTFVPVFAKAAVLPSILQNLLAPTLSLRIQACHALGGLAYALATLPPSSIHVAASDIVADFILAPSSASPTKANLGSPSKASTWSPIIRTLQTTMNAQDPTHIAQSAVWSLCVCSSLILILGSRMYTDRAVCITIMNAFKGGAKHKKAAIRHLFCASWRAANWVWFQPDYDLLRDEEGESEKEEEDLVEDKARSKDTVAAKRSTREAYFQVMQEIVETQAAMSTVAALLSTPPAPTSHLGIQEDANDEALRRVFDLIDAMANNPNPDVIGEAAAILSNLVTAGKDYATPCSALSENALALLPKGIFAQPSSSGLLFADLKTVGNTSIMASVKSLFNDLPTLDDVRALRPDEMAKGFVWDGILKCWRSVLSTLEMTDESELPHELTHVWENLLFSNIGRLQDGDCDTTELTSRVVGVLVGIIRDESLNFTVKSSMSNATSILGQVKDRETTGTSYCTNAELKIKVIKSLWTIVKTVFPRCDLGAAAEKLHQDLLAYSEILTVSRKRKVRSISPNNTHIVAPVVAWAELCATVILDSGNGESDAADAMKTFWGIGLETGVKSQWDAITSLDNSEPKSSVWKACIDVWRENDGHWEGGVVLLAAPFIVGSQSTADWSLSSEEATKWKDFYDFSLNKALDYGMDASSTTVIDCVAQIIFNNFSATMSPESLVQASDLLLDHLEPTEMREVPVHLVDLLNATFKNAYPVSERNMSPESWFIQTLTRVLEHVPKNLIKDFVESIGENVTVWLKDENEMWSEDELDYTFLPFYQHLLLRIQELPKDLQFLSAIAPLLDSVFSGRSMPEPIQITFKETFDNFWKLSPYGKMEEPIDGWPRPIRRCLGLGEDKENVAPVLEVPVTPSRKAFQDLADGLYFPRTPMAPMNGSNIPSPRRPHKPHAGANDSLFVPPLPVERSPLSPIRRRRVSSGSSTSEAQISGTPLLGASPFSRHGGIRFPESPTKRRRSMDQEEENRGEKENSSPHPTMPKKRRTSLTTSAGAPLGSFLFDLEPPVPVFERISNKAASPEKKKYRLRDRMGTAKVKAKNAVVQDQDGKNWSVATIQELASKAAAATTPSVRRTRLYEAMRARTPSPALSISSEVSTDSEEERGWVERELVPFPTLGLTATAQPQPVDAEAAAKALPFPTKHDTASNPPVADRKRKRTTVEVLIPASELLDASRARAKRKTGHSTSFDSTQASQTLKLIPASWRTPLSSGRIMKRSATTPASIPKVDLNAELTKRVGSKRIRRSASLQAIMDAEASGGEDGADDPFELQVRTKEPLAALQISLPQAPVPASRQVNLSSSDGPSSDDSMHLGQVTPHHLISPGPAITRSARVYSMRSKLDFTSSLSSSSGPKLSATSQVLRRAASLDVVLGSDDSVDSAPDSSPTRALAERKRRILDAPRITSLILTRSV